VGGSADSAASRQLVVENEKLRAQMVALREQAVAAEDAQRQARLAAENAAAERDEYREQAKELQQQLKEVMHVLVGWELSWKGRAARALVGLSQQSLALLVVGPW
jgi:hypothetical protein